MAIQISNGDTFENDKTGKLVIVSNARAYASLMSKGEVVEHVSFRSFKNGKPFGASHIALKSVFVANYSRWIDPAGWVPKDVAA